IYQAAFLIIMLAGITKFQSARLGWLGVALSAGLVWLSARGLLRGFSSGEFGRMVRSRPVRTAAWVLGLGGAAAALALVERQGRATGPFEVRAARRAEIRAPVAGFLKEVIIEEGQWISPGAVLARLEVPDLASRLARKRAEVLEVEARLRLVRQGPRPEEV